MKENKILNLISKHPEGVSITDIVNKTRESRSAIRIELAIMIGAKQIKFRQVGMAKLYTLKNKQHYGK